MTMARLLSATALMVGVSGALMAPAAGAVEPGTNGSGPAQHPRPVVSATGPWAPLRSAFPAGLWRRGTKDIWLPASKPAIPPAVTGKWNVQQTVNPPVRNGALTATSCTGAGACTAVGGYENRAGADVTLAERWNGSRWSVQHTPVPAGAIWSRFLGVSCTSARACTAAGYYFNAAQQVLPLVLRWNGRHWLIQAARYPAGSVASGFFAVSCTSARACTAAGARTTSAGETTTLAERWNGSKWRIQATADPAGSQGSEFLAVSCSSPRSCTAGGTYGNGAGVSIPLAERWDGRQWRIQAAAVPAGSAGSGFSALSCASPTACIAAGSYDTAHGRSVLLAERWTGGRWRRQATPRPAGATSSEFLAVSCTSVRACTAVGSSAGKAKKGLTLAERWNGSVWRIQASPSPARSLGSGFTAVSCTAARACTAAGSFDSRGGPLTLAGAWNGTSWRIHATPSPVGTAGGQFLAVSCASRRACIAVGTYSDSLGVGRTLAEQWNGTRWRLLATPDTAGAAYAELAGVSCSSASACTAVGTYFKAGHDQPLAERWNGTRWQIQATPSPAVRGGYLSAVSCPSASSCTAVGVKAGSDKMLAEHWDGRAWTVQVTPHPAGAGQLFGVSCEAASSCVAVGSSYSEVRNGAAWSFQPTAGLPAGSQGISLYGLSCASATFCAAAGSYFSKNGGPLTLAESWNGTTWQVQHTPNPVRTGRNGFSAVSCTSATACTAAGTDANNDFSPPVAFAEVWDGTQWRIQRTPSPAGTISSGLLGVSCTTATACTAVGVYSGPSFSSLTFAVAR